MGEGLSYNFTWFESGHIHDLGAELGLFYAPNGYCYSD